MTSPLRPRHRQEQGIAAAGRLAHRGTPYGASLSFATTTHLWPLSDPPSRKPPQRITKPHWGPPGQFRARALASSMLDSPCQGSRTGLTPPISTPVPSTPDSASPYGLSLIDYGRFAVRLLSRAAPTLKWPSFQPAWVAHISTGVDTGRSPTGFCGAAAVAAQASFECGRWFLSGHLD
jgi:hypothetical protein